MIPTYLDKLQLQQVFFAYTSDVGKHICEAVLDMHIVDSEKKRVCGFVTASFGQEEDNAGEYFSVRTPSGKPFSLMPIDNGIIKKNVGPATKKCDCAVANDTSLCFIEFKTKVFSANPLTIDSAYRKAIAQLSATIALFDNYHITRGVDFRDLRDVEAFICFKQGYPRTTSSQMFYQISFAESNKGIPLSFDREKIL